MKESITIKNFGGLKDVTIPLNSINIFIGKQASGKSVTAKLIYFFRKVFEDIFDGLNEGKRRKEIEEEIIERFKKYFPINSWSKGSFFIKYESGDVYEITENSEKISSAFSNISIERKARTDDINISFSKLFKEISNFQKGLSEELQEILKQQGLLDLFGLIDINKRIYKRLSERLNVFSFQMFIPAGRSFFSNIQSSIFSILSVGNSIDPFLVEFGSYYERFKHLEFTNNLDKPNKNIQDSLGRILNAKFITDNTGDYLVHNDGRKINLLFCSSGQQEVLPLALILKNQRSVLNSIEMSSITLYIT